MVELDAVYTRIDSVFRNERACQRWRLSLSARLERLLPYLDCASPAPDSAICAFCEDYIRLAPDMLDQISACAKASHTSSLFSPFLQICMDYFSQPAHPLLSPTDPESLLVRAYQCHRLIEELYDRNNSLRHSRLCNLEATQANLLAHALIGEPFANELDRQTESTLYQLIQGPDYAFIDLARYLEHARAERWADLTRRWQHLLSQHHIQFRFSLGMG